jgi:hypothetical protein
VQVELDVMASAVTAPSDDRVDDANTAAGLMDLQDITDPAGEAGAQEKADPEQTARAKVVKAIGAADEKALGTPSHAVVMKHSFTGK